MTSFPRSKAAIAGAFAFGILATTAIQPAVAQPASAVQDVKEVNGWNVVRAAHDSGFFQRTSPGQWTEFHNSGATYTFEERNRDAWSVYMYDASRNVWLQVDLHRNMVSAGTGNQERIDIYAITGSTAGAVTGNPLVDSGFTGSNLLRANFDRGLFQSIGNQEWIELGDSGAVFRFRETNRDEWSVYLFDASRTIGIQIDIHSQMIRVQQGNGPWGNLYAITSAR